MYTIKEIARQWNKTENDVLRMIKKECYQVWTFVSFYGYEVEGTITGMGKFTYNRPWELIEKFVRIPNKLIEGFLANKTLKIGIFFGDTDAKIFRPCEQNKQYELYSEMPSVLVEKKALCVKKEDVMNLGEKHPEVIGKTPEPMQDQHEEALNPNIKEDKSIAVDQTGMVNNAQAYVNEIQKDKPSGWKPPRGWISHIEEWVSEHAPTDLQLTKTARKGIATIVNPDRSKGPSKTKG